MNNKKFIFGIIITLVILVWIGFWYWSQEKKIEVPEEKGTVETAKTISESVPEIKTNPGEEVPEVNPLDRANPFKYINPLR